MDDTIDLLEHDVMCFMNWMIVLEMGSIVTHHCIHIEDRYKSGKVIIILVSN